MESDDLFVRKIRRHATRPPLASLTFDPKPPGTPRRSNPPSPAPPMLSPGEGDSHDAPAEDGTPPAPRFRDPLVLLGLPGGREGDAEGEEGWPPESWARYVAHHDVQSMLFDPQELTRACEGHESSGASAAGPPPEPGQEGEGAWWAGGGESDTPLVLSCPRFRREMGAPGELGEVPGLGVSPRGEPNAAVNVLEGSAPPRGARPPHAIEHVDLGATYYRHYFYGRGEALGARGSEMA